MFLSELNKVCFKIKIFDLSFYIKSFFFVLAYMSSPCHIEVFLTEKEEVIAKPTHEEPTKKKISKKKLARQKEKMMRE